MPAVKSPALPDPNYPLHLIELFHFVVGSIQFASVPHSLLLNDAVVAAVTGVTPVSVPFAQQPVIR